MQYRRLRAGLPAALCLIAAQHAWADTMRCGNKLVEVGDSQAAVQALCGAPATVQQGIQAKGTAQVPVETWTYNRGPNQLLVTIRFVNGQVVAITTLHQYGN
jgi:Protein of unknown function (DUF2845)